MIILSNIDTYDRPQSGERLVLPELEGLFDQVVESCVVGQRKPEPGIYSLALDRLGVQPGEAVSSALLCTGLH